MAQTKKKTKKKLTRAEKAHRDDSLRMAEWVTNIAAFSFHVVEGDVLDAVRASIYSLAVIARVGNGKADAVGAMVAETMKKISKAELRTWTKAIAEEHATRLAIAEGIQTASDALSKAVH